MWGTGLSQYEATVIGSNRVQIMQLTACEVMLLLANDKLRRGDHKTSNTVKSLTWIQCCFHCFVRFDVQPDLQLIGFSLFVFLLIN